VKDRSTQLIKLDSRSQQVAVERTSCIEDNSLIG